MTKSERIRKLAADGLTRSQIAASLGIRYQHVYNVLKRSGLLKSDKASLRQPTSIVVKANLAREENAWKGLSLPMHTALEAGLIREIKPAWNLQGL